MIGSVTSVVDVRKNTTEAETDADDEKRTPQKKRRAWRTRGTQRKVRRAQTR